MDVRRVVFVDRVPQGENLCVFSVIDLALDSPSYASGATGVDLLWSGAPMLAISGGMLTRKDQVQSYGVERHAPPLRSGSPVSEKTKARAVASIFQHNGLSINVAAGQVNVIAHSAVGYLQLALGLAHPRLSVRTRDRCDRLTSP